jgi:CO/xanthine dehydrogenase FAD-binding subunit
MGLYLRPATLELALDALGERALTVVAGGTDHYPARVGRPVEDDVLDITAIEGLRGIEERADHWHLGATTTWTDVIAAGLPPLFDGLVLAAKEVGGVQIQNAGTVCGNVCNASPAADGVPVLLALEARVELASARGLSVVPLECFLLGNRSTRRAPDELVTGLILPKPAGRTAGHFLKFGARKYLVISIVMTAAVVAVDAANRVTHARVAVGACSPVARRLPELEGALVGCPADASLGDVVHARHLAPLAPIDDVRGTRDYRLDAAVTLVRRLLGQLGEKL